MQRIFRCTKLSFVILLLTIVFVVVCWQAKDRNTLYQVSVLSGLMKGDYEGKVSLSHLRRHGDFGIGTFNRLDGEAIELDGVFYQVNSDGVVSRMSDSLTSPFAMTTFFTADLKFSACENKDYNSLIVFMDNRLPTRNVPYAVKINGKFRYIKTRSVPAQVKPFPVLAEVVKKQSIFEFHDIEGTMVGFRMPEYAKGVNVPGYHLHFLSSDKTKGGHVLDCQIDYVEIGLDSIDRFVMVLPKSRDFYNFTFSPDSIQTPIGESLSE